MKIEFDPAKNARNIAERDLAFERAAEFDFETAVTVVDDRREYGEVRFRAMGRLDGRVHVLVFVAIPEGIRVISLRRANTREVKGYAEATESRDDR